VQAPDEEDVVNIGGFSDDVFTLLAGFAAGQLSPENWVGEIEAVEL
jgi:60 kDa SS-A/Ro ribonucleoprotein